MSTHRLIISFNRLATHPVTRDEEVSLLWRLLKETEENTHDNAVKYYCWNMRQLDYSDFFSMVFSAVDVHVTEELLKNATALKESGHGREVRGGGVWTVTSVIPIDDLQYFGEAISLVSTSGMLAHRKQRCGDKRSYRTFFLNDRTTAEAWKQQLQERLVRRTNDFFGTDYTLADVQIIKAKHIFTETIMYKGGKRIAQYVRLKIKAPQEVLEMALYGGIGTSTGSGFGMVTVC